MSLSSSSDAAGAAVGKEGAQERTGFERSVGLFQAIAINMTQMCGIGPFITIPLMVAAIGGPQAIMGWIAGAILALADGLIWAELGAAMPGAGGTYLYLREAFQYRSGKLMPFLFVWTAVLFIPMIMSTGVIGLVQYLGFLWPNMTNWETWLVSVAVVAIVVFALWRRIGEIGFLSTVLWVIMLLSILAVTIASFTHFSPSLAFTYPAGAFTLDGKFFMGLGAGLVIGIYDYLGYNTTAYMGSEIRKPGRNIPLSIFVSILLIMAFYLAMNIGVLGVAPVKDIIASFSVAALVLQKTWGTVAAQIVTVLILITAFASVFMGLLGGSRVPYNAAKDGLFFRQFATLHPKHHFPVLGVLTMGVLTAAFSFFPLGTVISMLTAVIVLVQGVAQVVALTVLRQRQPTLRRPYRQWLYPVPSIIALIGWAYAYYAAGWLPIVLSLAWIVAGVVAFLIFARVEKIWPFAPNEIKEEYLNAEAETESESVA
ncbi:MAG TPA: APC family permease [Ktedonobacteraceae bacterium]